MYQKYVAARSAWYEAQPRGSIKTNQEYRRAMGLPLRYDRKSYEWCLDYKQMTKLCSTSAGAREWTKEEKMAYLDWNKAEKDRIEGQAVAEMGGNTLGSKRRDASDTRRRIDGENEEQESLYSAERQEEQCIVVKL
jgi:hypothetical protein